MTHATKPSTWPTLNVEQFAFPDGQMHVKVKTLLPSLKGNIDLCSGSATRIETRIQNGDDLLALLLAEEALRHAGATSVSLHITYLLGARMDRRIGPGEPFTLKVVAEVLRNRFDHISVLDPHSDVACALLDAEPVSALPYVERAIKEVGTIIPAAEGMPFPYIGAGAFALCAPDAGAAKRVEGFALALGGLRVIQCLKHRDPKTGELSGFHLAESDLPESILIVDDICDGGRTFSSVAALLKENGTKWVGLYVTHGIFSKGFQIEGVDALFTTTSYRDKEEYPPQVRVVGDPFA